MISGLCSQRKEQTLCSALTVRARTTHTAAEPSVPLRNYCLLWMPPFPTQYRPSVGQSGTYLTVTDLSSRLGSQRAALRKAGLWRRQWGFCCIYLPWEKYAIKTLRFKGAAWERLCLNSSKHAVIVVFHTFCLLLISCCACLKDPFLSDFQSYFCLHRQR